MSCYFLQLNCYNIINYSWKKYSINCKQFNVIKFYKRLTVIISRKTKIWTMKKKIRFFCSCQHAHWDCFFFLLPSTTGETHCYENRCKGASVWDSLCPFRLFDFSSPVMCMCACTCVRVRQRRDSLSAAVLPLGNEPRSTTMPSRQTLSSPPATTDPLFSVCNTRLSCTFSTREGEGEVEWQRMKRRPLCREREKSRTTPGCHLCGSAEGEEKGNGTIPRCH